MRQHHLAGQTLHLQVVQLVQFLVHGYYTRMCQTSIVAPKTFASPGVPSVAEVLKTLQQDLPLSSCISCIDHPCETVFIDTVSDHASLQKITAAPAKLTRSALACSCNNHLRVHEPSVHSLHQGDSAGFRGLFSPGTGRPWRQSQQSPPHQLARAPR